MPPTNDVISIRYYAADLSPATFSTNDVTGFILVEARIVEEFPAWQILPDFDFQKCRNFGRTRRQEDLTAHLEVGRPEAESSITAKNALFIHSLGMQQKLLSYFVRGSIANQLTSCLTGWDTKLL